MSAPEILSGIRRGWNRNPAGVTVGADIHAASAALWTHDVDDVQEVSGGPDFDHHLVAFQLNRLGAETYHDDRLAFAGEYGSLSFQVVPARVRRRGVVRGAFCTSQFHLPCVLIRRLCVEISGSASGIEIIDPKASNDPLMKRIAKDALGEMREHHPLSRLCIDLLGPDLAIELLRCWSNLAGTPAITGYLAKDGHALWQVKRATQYIKEKLADDVSLEDLSKLLGLSTFYLCRAFKLSAGLPPHRWRHQRRFERARSCWSAPSCR